MSGMRLELLGSLGLMAVMSDDNISPSSGGTRILTASKLTNISTVLPSLSLQTSVQPIPVPAVTPKPISIAPAPTPAPPGSSSWAAYEPALDATKIFAKEVVQQNLPVIATSIYNELPIGIQNVVKPLYNEVVSKPKVLTQAPAPSNTSVSESWNAKEVSATTEVKITSTEKPKPPVEEPKKNNTGLYVGLTMGALALVTFGIMAIGPSEAPPRPRVSRGLTGIKRKKRKSQRSAMKRKTTKKKIVKRKKTRR